MFAIITTLITILYFTYIYVKRWHCGEISKLATLPHCSIINGNVNSFKYLNGQYNKADIWKNLHTYYDQYVHHGAVRFSWGILIKPHVLILSVENLKRLLSSDVHTNRASSYKILSKTLLGVKGLALSDGELWKEKRKMILPAFHLNTLKNFQKIMIEKFEKFNEYIENQMNENNGLMDELYGEITYYTMAVLLESSMGYSKELTRSMQNNLSNSMERLLRLTEERAKRPWLLSDTIFKMSNSYPEYLRCKEIYLDNINEIIRFRKNYLLNDKHKNVSNEDMDINKKRRLAFLDQWLETHIENPQLITEEDIRGEASFILTAGHETTALPLFMTLFTIGHDLDVQRKVHKEMDDVFGYDCERDITMNDIRKLRYTEYCVMEALRLYSPVSAIGRQLSEPLVLDNGITLPKGTDCWVPIFMISKNRDIYPNPESYEPERFSPDAAVKIPPYAYLSFSGGPRDCIGQKYALTLAKTVLALILRKYRIESQTPLNQIQFYLNFTPQLKSELKMKFVLRQE